MNYRKSYYGLGLAAIILICSSSDTKEELKFHAVIDNDYNALFTTRHGWTGADIANTVPLSDSLTLWLFGDTWIGRIKNNKHINSTLISNTVAIQYGKTASKKNLKFYYRKERDKPYPLFAPSDGKGAYWPDGGGIKTKDGLYLIAGQVAKQENDTSVFGFESLGSFILKIENPLDDPDKWNWKAFKIPFFISTDDTEVNFGIFQFIKDGYIYIYGTEFMKKEIDRYMLLTRVPEDQILNFDSWEFYSKGRWEKDFRKADRLCNNFGAEYSVSFHPTLNKYITVYNEMGMSEKIMLRTAVNPEGPWSEQIEIYRAPERGWSRNYFCYAGRAHIGLSGADDLLVSYVCNSFDFWEMAADARIYRPKFIRIKFER